MKVDASVEPVTRCGDCAVLEGRLHRWGCFRETCPFCCGQLVGCGCPFDRLPPSDQAWLEANPDADPPPAMNRRLRAIVRKKGRVPFIRYPVLCARCGVVDPEFFKVSDRIWRRYVDPGQWNSVLCRSCFDEIRALIDAVVTASAARRTRSQGRLVPERSRSSAP